MGTEGWRVEGFDTPTVLFFGGCLLLFMLTISYIMLGRPDAWLRTRQDGGYFPFDLYIFTKRYSTLQDAAAMHMAKRIRELLFTMFALAAFIRGCGIYLEYT